MTFDMTKEEFLKSTSITEESWVAANIEWQLLEDIAKDYVKSYKAILGVAEQVSSRIRTFDGVHSVRWRIKNPIHLLKKIVRKRGENEPKEKWLNISVENYLEVVTDLIGVRALHLFQNECLIIDSAIQDTWDLVEPVVFFKRDGDKVNPMLIERNVVDTIHKSGYRSIHYIAKTQPEKVAFHVEIQVRTIFQEGWSEIDHKVKYPDYSDNPHLAIFLDMFNGLAGSADEMGSFVQELTKILRYSEQANIEKELAVAERDKTLQDMKQQFNEYELLKAEPKGGNKVQMLEKQNSQLKEVIEKLKTDLDKLNSPSLQTLIPQNTLDAIEMAKSNRWATIDKNVLPVGLSNLLNAGKHSPEMAAALENFREFFSKIK